jgi:hypothetical protein
MILSVMGIIGYTQGVKLTRTPAKNTTIHVRRNPREAMLAAASKSPIPAFALAHKVKTDRMRAIRWSITFGLTLSRWCMFGHD